MVGLDYRHYWTPCRQVHRVLYSLLGFELMCMVPPASDSIGAGHLILWKVPAWQVPFTVQVACDVIHATDEKPTIGELMLIRWNNGAGICRLRIIEAVCNEWENIGTILGIPEHKLQTWMETSRDPQRCCNKVFKYWLKNPPKRYPPTWGAFIELLKDIPFEELAKNLKEALIHRV